MIELSPTKPLRRVVLKCFQDLCYQSNILISNFRVIFFPGVIWEVIADNLTEIILPFVSKLARYQRKEISRLTFIFSSMKTCEFLSKLFTCYLSLREQSRQEVISDPLR